MHLILVDNLLPPYQGRLETLDVHPHLGLISLAAIAQSHQHRVSIFDPKRLVRARLLPYDHHIYERVSRSLLDQRPDAIGFTTLGCSFIFALKVAEQIEQAEPDLPILLGGPHATMLHREIMERYSQFDVIVRHEAEQTIADVLAGLERRDFTSIPGITWRATEGFLSVTKSTPGSPLVMDLDSLPIPSYELYPIEELELDLMRVEAGRGCPFDCTFCSTASFFQRSYRLKSPERLVKEMDLLNERYGVIEFKLDHDLFTVNQKKVRAFCEAVKGRDYHWRVSARVDCVNDELLRTMSEAGCVGMYFGIETGSPRMQRIAQKRLDLELVEPMLDAAERYGIKTTASFITGYPEEQQEDQEATLDMLGNCFRRPAKSCIPQLHMLMPEPGTELYSQYGQQLKYDGYITDYNSWLLDGDDEQSILNDPEIFVTYYFYPTAIPRENFIFVVDACRELRKLGHIVLNYALRFYNNRFSRLVLHFRNWAAQNAPNWSVNSALILDFFVSEYGIHHHLTSLVRFMMGTSRAREPETFISIEGHPATGTIDPNQRYQLGPRTFLFKDIHDCHALLARIQIATEDREPLPVSEQGLDELKCYLMVASGEKDRVFKNYVIDQATYEILSMFETPRLLHDMASALAELAGGLQIDEQFFEDLVYAGALIPTMNSGDAQLDVFPTATVR